MYHTYGNILWTIHQIILNDYKIGLIDAELTVLIEVLTNPIICKFEQPLKATIDLQTCQIT